MDDDFGLWIIYCIIFSLIGFGVLKLHDIRLEKYPQEAKSYYEKQFENAGDRQLFSQFFLQKKENITEDYILQKLLKSGKQ